MNTLKRWALCISLAAVSWEMSAAKLGDPAASLEIQTWAKGKPVDVKDGKSIYIVEFWATWCGPCKVSIPHLSELQKKFKDKGVVVVGVTDEPVSKVKPFVDKMGDQMAYVVACDKDQKTSAAYMEAYGQGGIPTAFVVGKNGKVLWLGHPMDGLDKVIEDVVNGKYDLAAAIKRDEGRVLMNDFQKLSALGDPQAKAVGLKLVESAGEDVDKLCEMAFMMVADSSNKNRDFALAESALDKAEKLGGKQDHRVIGIRSVARFESGKQEEGLALAKAALEASKEDDDKARYNNFIRVMKTKMEGDQKQDKAKP